MKSFFISVIIVFAGTLLMNGQSADQMISKCIMNAGNDAKYLKDFRIQLGKAAGQEDLRFKAKMSLWKNTKYRFTLCNADGSKGQLILNIKDATNNPVLSSFDKKSGKIYPYVDLICNKSGVYQLYYDFIGGEEGSGIGVISMIK
jgi:hypothetical protein